MTVDFGEGFEHVKSIEVNGKIIFNSGYIYEGEKTEKYPISKIISGN